MGTGQYDDSIQAKVQQQPALNTTRLVIGQLNQTDFVLHVGDISYAEGYASVVSIKGTVRVYKIPVSHIQGNFILFYQWDDFFDLIQPVSTRVPYMVCIGNHERDYPHSKYVGEPAVLSVVSPYHY